MAWAKWKQFNQDYKYAELPRSYLVVYKDEPFDMSESFGCPSTHKIAHQMRSDLSDYTPTEQVIQRFIWLDQQRRNNTPFVVTEKYFNPNMDRWELVIHKLGAEDNSFELHSYIGEPLAKPGDTFDYLYEIK